MSSGRLLLLESIFTWRRITRRGDREVVRLARFFGWGVEGYLLLNCIALGYYLNLLLKPFSRENDLVALVDRHLLVIFLILTVARHYLEKSPSLEIRPLLLLPVRKRSIFLLTLIGLLTTRINLALLFIAASFWWKNILATAPLPGALFWIGGLGCLHLLFIAVGVVLRVVLSDLRSSVLVAAGAVACILALNLSPGFTWLEESTGNLFDGMRRGQIPALVPLLGIAAAAMAVFVQVVQRSLYLDIRR
ncbi:MAG: DUF5687 family protein [Bacteroidota bacterium]